MHRRRVLAAGGAIVALIGVLGGARSAGAVVPAEPAHRSSSAPGKADISAVTLLTGDTVRLIRAPGQDPAVVVQRGQGREGISFLQTTRRARDGMHLTVIPSDAFGLLAAGRLDARLFDVTELANEGRTTPSAPAVPLILSYAAGTSAQAAAPMLGASTVRALPSINATAVRPDRDSTGRLWATLTGAGTGRVAPLTHSLTAGVSKVWLDARAHPTLDVSVPLIGAPTAWNLGFTGAGVTVGLLDTGIKADHPDLAGKIVEARDFTGTAPDASDDVGHGTHVAGIIAGTGAASNGKYRGVAPGAKLVNGKVCTVDGCDDSAIIAAMQWIAPKVHVVNMSLGGGPTDGTDPVAQAVDNLTRQYGTLFVIAAGNDGSLLSVDSPGSADAALTVGSTTKQDTTSDFSSRGPRVGDYAVKPDIAAPGTGIVSARAPGTEAGDFDPVDANYARLSGTSMATPHIAGAAAIIEQQHPGWSPDQIKQALMSTAKPVANVFDEGAGRVDVARAVTQQVAETGGSLSFGEFRWPHNEPSVTKTVGYRNDGATDVTLALTLTGADPAGKPAPAGLFSVSATHVTVPAHGTASVTVTANPAGTASGMFGGRLTATAAGVTVQAAMVAYLEPESYNVTASMTGRTTKVEEQDFMFVDTDTGDSYFLQAGPDGRAVLRAAKGHYDVVGLDLSVDPADPTQSRQVTFVARPAVNLNHDVTIALDARRGHPVNAVVDQPDVTPRFRAMGVFSEDVSGRPGPRGTIGASLEWIAGGTDKLFATQTGGRVSDHNFGMYFKDYLWRGAIETSPTLYNLTFLELGRIPGNTVYRMRDRDLATVDARYHAQGGPSYGLHFDFAALHGFAGVGGPFETVTIPSRRTEFYTTDPSTPWTGVTVVTSDDTFRDEETHWKTRAYRPGPTRDDWNSAPLGPAFGDTARGWVVTRVGTQLHVAVPLLAGNDPHQYNSPSRGMTGTTTLSRGGTVLGSTSAWPPGVGTFPIPDAPGVYTLHATAQRSVPWSVIGTSTDVTWTFREPGAAAPVKPLPLMVVRASGAVDDQDRAPAGRPFPLTLTVQRQTGAPRADVPGLLVQVSFDDGTTWKAVPTPHDHDGNGHVVVNNPATPGFVSLRITAVDENGNSVTQTVIRAYQTA
jgi:subtilisin family serine protease